MSERGIREDLSGCTSAGTSRRFATNDHHVAPAVPSLMPGLLQDFRLWGREMIRVRRRENSGPRLLSSFLCAQPTQFCDTKSDPNLASLEIALWLKLPRSVSEWPFVCMRIRTDFRKRTDGALSSVDFVVSYLSKFQSSVLCCLFSINKCAAF